MLSDFDTMSYGHPGCLILLEHQLELLPNETTGVHCDSSRARPKAQKFEKAGVDKLFSINIIEPSQTKWATSIVPARKKDRLLRLRLYYSIFNLINISGFERILEMDAFID